MMQEASLLTAAALFLVGIYALVFKDNLIKKVIGLTFITDAANLTLVSMGYRQGGIVPIILPGMDATEFAQIAGYPLPMALVLTNIVIGVATTALILGLVIRIYNSKKTTSAREVWTDEQ
ncbi:MAG: sodium:proton antiporter [Candidatus Altiarchaeota archaeon]|nr:sodium:proton antiporter [Candidatus Altiarchaeota archaeon]